MLTYFYFLTVAVIFAPVKCALEASDKKSRLLILHTSLNGYSSTLRSTLKATQKPYVLPSTCIFDLNLNLFDQVYLPPSIAFHSDNIDNLCKINTIVYNFCDLAEYILVHNCTIFLCSLDIRII